MSCSLHTLTDDGHGVVVARNTNGLFFVCLEGGAFSETTELSILPWSEKELRRDVNDEFST